METREYFCRKRNPMKKFMFGFLLVAFGAVMLGFNLGKIDESYRHIVYSWQMLLIAIGLINLFDRHSYGLGVILISVGSFFILPSVFPGLGYNFTQLFWPALIIICGLIIIVKRNKHEHPHFHKHFYSERVNDAGYIEKVNIFGGSKSVVSAPEFKGGEIVNVFGGSKIDLTQTTLAVGRNVLEVSCVFGGVSLTIPSDWVVQIEVTAVMGGFQDKRLFVKKENTDDRILVITGVTVFGGGEIK